MPEHEVLYDWMCSSVLWRPLFQPSPQLEGARRCFEHDIALPGVGDAGAHSSVFTDAAAATNLLTWWSRDRPADRGPQMTLEHAVHKHTAAIADFYEMHDRGVVAA